MIVKQHATPYRANARNEGDTRVSQSENGQRGVGGRDRVDGHRYRRGVTRPPFVRFMALTLRYDYSRGYCVLLPTLVSDALHASRIMSALRDAACNAARSFRASTHCRHRVLPGFY
jgi:hypothetical protein